MSGLWCWESSREPVSPSPPCSSAPTKTFCRVELGFPGHAGQVEQAEPVDDFAATAVAVVAIVNVEDILCSGGQGP